MNEARQKDYVHRMTAGDRCSRTVYIVRPDESAVDAARLMKKYHVGCLVVVEDRDSDRTPIAIVTDRDLAVKGLTEGQQRLETMQVSEIMSQKLVTALETETMYDVRKKMRARGVRRIPVVDAEDRLLGIIAFDDVVEWMAEELTDLAQLIAREQEHERGRS